MNALPTSSRLHDGLFDVCPFCSGTNDHITHLVQCAVAYAHALRVLICRSSTKASVFRDKHASHLIRTVRASLGRVREEASFWIEGESLLFSKNEILPCTFEAFISARLALDEPDLSRVRIRVVLLYIIQYCFTTLRTRCCAGDAISTADIHATMHAAYSSLV